MDPIDGYMMGSRLHLSTASPREGWSPLNDAEQPPRRSHSIAVGFIEEASEAVHAEAPSFVRATQRSLLSVLLRSVSDVSEETPSTQQQGGLGSSMAGHAAGQAQAGTVQPKIFSEPVDIPSTT